MHLHSLERKNNIFTEGKEDRHCGRNLRLFSGTIFHWQAVHNTFGVSLSALL